MPAQAGGTLDFTNAGLTFPSPRNQVRVYNYNTMDKVKQFEAHTDYIR